MFYLPTVSKRAILTLVYHATLFLLWVWMCIRLPYKDGLRKYSLIFQCRSNSTHKIYIKSMHTVIGERREFFSISKTKSISYHPTQSYYEIDFHICLYSVAIQKESMQIKTCYNSIWSVYMKTYFSFGVFIYI